MASTDATTSEITITPDDLAKSARTYRRDLLTVPMAKLGPALNYMTLRRGIRSSETVGELSADMEVGPYDPNRVSSDGVDIKGRTLNVYFGSCIKRFDPNQVVQSIYGSDVTNGEGLKNVPISLKLLTVLAAALGNNLGLHLFDAVRNDSGTKTVDLFNGFDTIANTEITAGNISAANKNLYEFSAAITKNNAVEAIQAFLQSANDELIGFEDGAVDPKPGEALNLLVPRQIVFDYAADYKTTTGHSPIYDKYNQTVVEGFPNVRLVPMRGMANSKLLKLTTKSNMLIGCNTFGEQERIDVQKHHEFLLSFVATLFWGTQYESIRPERIMFGKLMD